MGPRLYISRLHRSSRDRPDRRHRRFPRWWPHQGRRQARNRQRREL